MILACRRSLVRQRSPWRANAMLLPNAPSMLLRQHPHHQQQQQVRPYLYLPLSWEDFQERFQRWVERSEQRMVQVKLLRRDTKHTSTSTTNSPTTTSEQLSLAKQRRELTKLMGRNRSRWNSWWLQLAQRQQQHQQQQQHTTTMIALPLPLSSSSMNTTLTPTTPTAATSSYYRTRYQGWKTSYRTRYQGWKTRRKEQYQGWKRTKQQQYQGWKLRRQQAWVRTKQVLVMVDEYSRPEWFDEMGRPLTSRDSTGRFVNPWRSQSTNGLHSVDVILRWRVQRTTRLIRELGWMGSLLPNVPWPWNAPAPPIVQPPSPPLPLPWNDQLQLTWLGHSTCWIQMNDFTILTDPMFSPRSGPHQSIPIGVVREYPPSHSIDELVEHAANINVNTNPTNNNINNTTKKIDICCITHDHYDHMDEDSVNSLRPFVNTWVVPLGIADWLVERCDIERSSIIELEWWQQAHLEKDNHGTRMIRQVFDNSTNNNKSSSSNGTTSDLVITCCPASHWASRTMTDRNLRLWCSFALASPTQHFFLCGDTGYPTFPLFRQIGDALGPFDLAAIPIGAYKPSEINKEAHVNPKEAVQIHKDLRSLKSVAIHWGSFPLSEEDLDDPPKDLKRALAEEDADATATPLAPFGTLGHGATAEVSASHTISDTTEDYEYYYQDYASSRM
jgi:N-acyl-phosphatidylethanolamine-hydrolysing phospholipase D